MTSEIKNILKYTIDAASWGNIIATLTSLLPPIAALMSIIWVGIQIYDRFNRDKE